MCIIFFIISFVYLEIARVRGELESQILSAQGEVEALEAGSGDLKLCWFHVTTPHAMHFAVEVSVQCPVGGTAGTKLVELAVSRRPSWIVDENEWLEARLISDLRMGDSEVRVLIECPAGVHGHLILSLPFHKEYEPATLGGLQEYETWPVTVEQMQPYSVDRTACSPSSEKANLVEVIPVGNLDHLPYVLGANLVAFIFSVFFIVKHIISLT